MCVNCVSPSDRKLSQLDSLAQKTPSKCFLNKHRKEKVKKIWRKSGRMEGIESFMGKRQERLRIQLTVKGIERKDGVTFLKKREGRQERETRGKEIKHRKVC